LYALVVDIHQLLTEKIEQLQSDHRLAQHVASLGKHWSDSPLDATVAAELYQIICDNLLRERDLRRDTYDLLKVFSCEAIENFCTRSVFKRSGVKAHRWTYFGLVYI